MFGRGQNGSKISLLLLVLTLVLTAFLVGEVLPTTQFRGQVPGWLFGRQDLIREAAPSGRLGQERRLATSTLPMEVPSSSLDMTLDAQTPGSLPILSGATWYYFKGTSEPPAAWNTPGFDDTSWLFGPSGFGYGDGDDATVLSDMRLAYSSVYTRKLFNLADPSAIGGLELKIDYDDGFVAYLNGTEVVRRNVTGTPAYDSLAAASHEASAGGGAAPEVISLNAYVNLLVSGTNALAIQGLNRSLDSSDLTLIAELRSVNGPPNPPANPSPADGASGVSTSPQLCVQVSDPNGTSLDVTFHGREFSGAADPDFTIIALPDTQYYSASYPSTYTAQTQWIIDNRVARNIVYITELGDCVDSAGVNQQWVNADAAWDLVESPVLTGLVEGIPYGIAVGNHDQNPANDPGTISNEGATTSAYNDWFGVSRFLGRGFYGGHYGLNNDNHYQLFSAGGMDFIDVQIEFMSADSPLRQAVLGWANGVLQAYPDRRAIITSHYLMEGGSSTAFSNQGQAVYDALKGNPNLFLMLAGHLDQAQRRSDIFQGRTVNTLRSDYQTQPNGGNGWLRIMTFSPANGTIDVKTYSPTLNQFLTDATNQFVLSYDMNGGQPFATLGTVSSVASGGTACLNWPGLQQGTRYEWYVTVSDGTDTTTGPTLDFSTTATCVLNSECDDANPCTADVCNAGTCQNTLLAAGTGCSDGDDCNGAETCNAAGMCQPGTPVNCNDADACTTDSCVAGACQHMGISCDDQAACTIDTCSALSGCQHASTCTGGQICNLSTGQCDAGCTSAGQCNDADACTTDACSANSSSLSFDGANDHVDMGEATGLNSPEFTVEFWFKRTGTGTTTSTGTSGIDAVPIVAKGAPQDEAATHNMNYFVGLRQISTSPETWALAADFEEGSGGTGPLGLNHPVTGALPVSSNVWHHAAATYDGVEWRLYLDGVLDTVQNVEQPAASDSLQHFGFGSALETSGATHGRYQGLLDEVRLWNYARTGSQIDAARFSQIAIEDGLLGHWGLNEGTGAVVNDSAPTPLAENGSFMPDGATGPTWSSDIPGLAAGSCSHTPIPSCCLTNSQCDDNDACTVDQCPMDPNASSLHFNGTGNYVSMGAASGLNASPAFTLETWFKWDGSGVATSTGSGGITAIPLMSKGRAEIEAPANRNMNYFLGISGSRLAADFEDAATGLNHPVCMNPTTTSAISTNVWHHAAAVYNGSCWQIYVDGALQSIDTSCSTCSGGACTVCPGASPEPASIQAFALGSAITSASASPPSEAAGFFSGWLDEARVWNVAKSQAEIQSAMSRQILSDPDPDAANHLLGRWGLDDNPANGTVADSSAPAQDGTVVGATFDSSDKAPLLTNSCYHFAVSSCCISDSQCADADPCTADTCSNNVCVHAPTPGCCVTAADCNDSNACTDDSCVSNSCVHSSIPGCCAADTDCGDGLSCTQDVCPAAANVSALSFDGVDDRVTMGAAPGLNTSPAFTVETWFYWTGGGVATGTGTQGLTAAIPLVSKGAAEAESPANLNMNYFLGVSGSKLAADFEDNAGGLNHPVCGSTTISTNTWHHAAAVYNGACWQLYLDGRPESLSTGCSSCTGGNCTICPNAAPEPGSTQHFALGTALNSSGAPSTSGGPAGFFAGRLDEVRVWNVERTQAQIQDGMNRLVPTDPANHLLGHWGLDENATASTADSTSPAENGTLVGANGLPAWVAPPGATIPSFGTANTCFHPASPAQGCCSSDPQCADSDPCTSGESCNLATFACSATVVPNCCDANSDCTDNNSCTTDICSPSDSGAISFNGSSQHISFGVASTHTKLALTRFTLEAWIKWNGTGATTSTGGITAIPIVTKGRGVGESPANINLNYFMGLAGGKLAADFEDTAGGLNHPVTGATTVTQNVWHHVAATYDGTAVKVYLDGVLDGTTATTATPESTSVCSFGVATSFDQSLTTPVAAGFFGGQIDEVRVWNRGLPQSEIQANLYEALTSGSGLVGRWGMNEASGTAVLDSTASPVNGTLVGSPARVTTSLIVGHCSFTQVANGTSCSDGSLCTTADTCQSGVCGGTTVDCNDGNLCTTDTCNPATGCVNSTLTCSASDQCHDAGTCNPATGVCSNPAKPDGTSCNDGSPCTQTDTCQTGTCVGSGAPDCDDGNPCTIDTCDTGAPGGCLHTPGNAGTVCRVATGACDQTEVCNGISATCPTDIPAPDGTACNDGDACTQTDTCLAGVCAAGSPVVCTASDQCHNAGTCNPATGVCSNPSKADGSTCSDEDACTQADTCQAGSCVGSSPVTCTASDPCHDVGTCNPATGVCSNPPKADGTVCSDANACTQSDTCQAGSCVGSSPVTCTASDQCHDAGTCDPANGTCSNPPKTEGTTCNDGNACTETDTCQAGVCIGASPVFCAQPDQCHDVGTCDPGSGTCTYVEKPNGSTCNDGNSCTQVDTCQAGSCVGSSPVTCTASDQCHDAGTCNPVTGVCSNPPKADGAICSDANVCTQVDTCQAGSCVGSSPVVCTASDQCHDAGTCNPGTGVCSNPPKADGSTCSDANACTQSDTCQAGSCVGSSPVVCTASDQCHNAGTCNPADGVCTNPSKADGTVCSDGNGCTQADTCQAGACAGGNPVVCTASDQCHDAGTCNPGSGVCSNPAKPDGTVCSDLSVCTTVDACQAGVCSGSAPLNCDDTNACTLDGCDATSGCTHNPINTGQTTCGVGACIMTVDNCVNGEPQTCAPNPPAGPNLVVQFDDQPMKYAANTGPTSIADSVLVQLDSPMRYLANASDPALGLSWKDESFDDSAWLPPGTATAPYGIGYETAPPGAGGLIHTSVPAGTLSVYTRAQFTIADITKINALFLGADYDDGYVAYINGVEVARSASMPAGAPGWNTPAASHESSNAVSPDYGTLVDITAAAMPVLHNGTNVLAIGVWNISGTSTDLVLVPRLSAAMDWTAELYDDSSWATGPKYGVGYDTDTAGPNALSLIKTTVPAGTFSVFTRARFTIPDAAALAAITSVSLGADYDDGYVAWINGVEVASSPEMPTGPLAFDTNAALHESSNGATPNYGPPMDISLRALPALHVGVNVLAIGVWNSAAATSTDLVLVPRLSLGEAERCDGVDNDCDGAIDEGFPNADGDAVADCIDPDDDNDGTSDDGDCAPLDPGSSGGAPSEVQNVSWVGPVRTPDLVWTSQGPGILYDVAGGLVSQLRLPPGGAESGTCLPAADNLPSAGYADSRGLPAAGEVYYYIVRAEKSTCTPANGTYGYRSSGAERLPTVDCP